MPCPPPRNAREFAARLIWQLLYGRTNAVGVQQRDVLAACFAAWRARNRRWDLIALVAHAMVSRRRSRRFLLEVIFWWFERRRQIGMEDLESVD